MAQISRTRNVIARDILDDLGKVGVGQDADAGHMAKAVRYMNDNIAAWQNVLDFMSQRATRSVTTVADTASYSLNDNTLYIESPYIRVDGQDIPLGDPISLEEYQEESNKSGTGQPTKCYVDYLTPTPAIYLLPVPSAVYTVYFTAHEEFDDMDQSDVAPDLKARWYKALRQQTVVDMAHWARRPELAVTLGPIAEKSFRDAVAASSEGRQKRGMNAVCPVL